MTNTPRCLFWFVSPGELAIVVGGCGSSGNILSSTKRWAFIVISHSIVALKWKIP
ncbi:hypothetical protein HanIR_Chr11g0530901 [Helianthus annuus]|nr:hypothetical protein HanIR_Chr11g0530901 [Helianthus annuus]